jgi:phosphocarrier protein
MKKRKTGWSLGSFVCHFGKIGNLGGNERIESVSAIARATVCNKKGLHARAAAKLVKTAAGYDARVEVLRLPRPNEAGDPASAGATSILSLLMLAAEMGVEIELRGEGAQAEEAVQAIAALIGRRFEEDE